jgi:hypothetical protein
MKTAAEWQQILSGLSPEVLKVIAAMVAERRSK